MFTCKHELRFVQVVLFDTISAAVRNGLGFLYTEESKTQYGPISRRASAAGVALWMEEFWMDDLWLRKSTLVS